MSRSTILVVDDDEANLEILPYALSRAFPHLDIEACRSPLVALQRLEARDYALLMTDLRMPELDGLTVLKRACVIRPETSVIVMSTAVTMVQASRALQMGAFDVVPKSISHQELTQIVNCALQIHHSRREIKGHQLTLRRLRSRVAAVQAMLQAAKLRQEPPAAIRQCVTESRHRNDMSLRYLKQSLQRITARSQRLQQVLLQAERGLRVSLAEAEGRACNRLDSFSHVS